MLLYNALQPLETGQSRLKHAAHLLHNRPQFQCCQETDPEKTSEAVETAVQAKSRDAMWPKLKHSTPLEPCFASLESPGRDIVAQIPPENKEP